MFYIYGNLNFVPGGYDPWIEAYKSLENYVRPNESESVLTYYFGTPSEFQGDHSSSNFMLAFEQYRVREDLYETHFHSPAMGPFLKKIPATMTTGLDLTHYEDVSGFLHRSGDDGISESQRGVWYDTRIWCKDASTREEVLKKLGKVAKQVEQEEKGTWSFLVLKSLDEDYLVRIFERYENQKALERHRNNKGLLEFFQESKDLVRSMEGRSYVPNGWGWLHR